MRFWLAQVVIFATACLIMGDLRAQAQSPIPDVEPGKSCPLFSAFRDQSSDPEISVAGVTFSGFLRMPVSDQDEIAASIKGRTYKHSLDQLNQTTKEALGIATAGWQNHGYLKVEVNGYATAVGSGTTTQRVALSIHVDEGPQYRLGAIAFNHNRAIANVAALLRVFPIKEGDVFSHEKIAIGLENLRKVYGELGYANFTSVSETRFDERRKLVYLDIDVDEGKQFYVGAISILGVDGSSGSQILKDLPLKPGQIYNERLVELFLKNQHGAVLPNCECNNLSSLQPDEKAGLVTITFDFRPCLGGS